VWSGLGSPGDGVQRIVHGSREARRRRRPLRSKLSGGSAVNNGTGGQQCALLLATPVASMRLEELLVRGSCSNPVRKNRDLTRGLEKTPGIEKEYKAYKSVQKAYFAGSGGSARMRSLVLRHFEQETQAQIRTEAGRKMALRCEFCGKAPHFGNVISHANNTRRRRWNPNLKRLRAVVAGVRKQVRVCTACIRAGKVKKAA